jgi:arginase
MRKDITFLINSSEITAGTRGASLGPGAVITAARTLKNNFFGNYNMVYLKDNNNVLDSSTDFQFAKNAVALLDVFERISSALGDVFTSNQFPFVLAGDHGSAGGTIAGIKKQFPDKRLGVVWIDAHGDIHSPYTTPSGNMHGMPLSTALNSDNLNSKVNSISNEEKLVWDALKELHGIVPKIHPEDLIFIGVRDLEEQEVSIIEELNIRNILVEEVRSKGTEIVVNEVLTHLNSCDLIYISFDVDSMDPDHTSYGTGTPVKNGLFPEEAETIMKGIIASNKVCCLEVVEVNPCLDDKKNKMAEITFGVVEKLVKKIENL